MQHYDIIGDIHGHADALIKLLDKLGYMFKQGAYRHESNKVIFLGDFIDRGPQQREVIDIVRPMIEQGAALSVMGNHEFNAICYATKDADGKPLREHSDKNYKQHEAFLKAYSNNKERQQVINWFKALPVYIDTGAIRCIHASWNKQALFDIVSLLDNKNCLKDDAYEQGSIEGSNAYEAIELLLKGPEIDLPEGVSFKDKDGHTRQNARIKWWAAEHLEAHQRLNLGTEITQSHKLQEVEIDNSHHYPKGNISVFVGHYWLDEPQPKPLSDNCACLDYSIAKKGKLVVYKWRGEAILKKKQFDWLI